MLDNVSVAILTKVNELAERRGLKPYDFVASVRDVEGGTILAFEVPASGNALREERFDKMLQDLGVTEGVLKAPCGHIIDAIDSALQRSPKSRV
jgi:hypothetical protein